MPEARDRSGESGCRGTRTAGQGLEGVMGTKMINDAWGMSCCSTGEKVRDDSLECLRCRIITLEQIFAKLFIPEQVEREIQRLKELILCLSISTGSNAKNASGLTGQYEP